MCPLELGSQPAILSAIYACRYHISHLFKGMWESPVHRQAMITESKTGKHFVKFINMLMNDTTFLLDECLEYLKRIHQTQVRECESLHGSF